MSKRFLSLVLVLILAACQPEGQPLVPPLPTPQVVVVGVNSALDAWLPSLNQCADKLDNAGLILESGFGDMTRMDLILRFGPVVEGGIFASGLSQDEVVIIVNPHNPIKDFTQKQVTDIYTGRVQNWQQLGGEDEQIEVWTYLPGDDARRVFDEVFLKGQQIHQKVLPVPHAVAMLEVVHKGTNAVGFLLKSRLTNAVRQMVLPEALQASLSQPIVAIAASRPGDEVYAMLVCLQESGEID
jgi:hypothetical protein